MNVKDIKKALKKYQPSLDQNYQQKLQVAKYTNLSDIEKSNLLLNSGVKQQHICFLFNGNIQSSFDNDKILYHTINCLDNKIDQNTYTIVYIVAEHDGLSQLKRFRKMLKQLSSKYYIQLQCLYFYQASLNITTKLWFQCSRRWRIWLKKTQYIEQVEDLQRISHFQANWINFFPKQNLNLEKIESTQLIKQSQSSFGQHMSKQKLNQFQIPIVIDYLLSYFMINTDRFQIPDIFRKQGSLTEEEQLYKLLINENYECLNAVKDVRIVCSLIKRFFLELPEPLIPNNIFNHICNQINLITSQTEIALLDEIFAQLPIENKSLLIVMVRFLICVGSYSELNHMNMNNLAIIFAPCFMRAQIQSVEQIGYQMKFLKLLFDNFDKMFPKVSIKLYLQQIQTQPHSSSSCDSSNGLEFNINKNQDQSSSEEEINSQFQQKQK